MKSTGIFRLYFFAVILLSYSSCAYSRTGVICTIPVECDPIRHMIATPIIEKFAQRSFVLGTIEDEQIVLVKSPMGKSENAVTSTLLAQHFLVDRIVSIGTAGSLVKELPIGSILMADTVFAHDEGRYLNIGFVTYRPKPKNMNLMQKKIANEVVFKGVLASGDQFVGVSDKARSIRELSGGHAVDTNSTAIDTVCKAFNIDCMFFRYISDGANVHSSNDFQVSTRQNRDAYVSVIIRWILDVADET